jgi:4-amino-4-deoxy-L-arabinose transferase-like glycosyltransferase
MRLNLPLKIVVGAFLVRLLFNVFVTGMDNAGLDSFHDGRDYDALGLSLATGSGYMVQGQPNTFRAPGYPFFLAGVYALFGHSVAAVKVLQSALGALTCLLMLWIGERLFSRGTGILAAAIAAVYPFLVYYSGILMSEVLFVFLATLFLYLLVRFRENFSLWWAIAAGLMLGLMNLTRPVALLLPVLLFVWLWIEVGSKRSAAVLAGFLAVWMLVPIAPWAIRNYAVTKSVVLVTDQHWVTLYAGNNREILRDPEKIGGWVEPEPVKDYRAAYLGFIGRTLLHEPMEMARLEAYKLYRLWSVVPTSAHTTPRDTLISALSYGVLLPLFLIGLALALRSPSKPWVLVIWILHLCLMTLLTHGSTRFRAPIEPVLVLFGALALERVWLRVAVAPSWLLGPDAYREEPGDL